MIDVRFCASDQLRQLERTTGRTLANDQQESEGENSHMRGGGTGAWREFVEPNMVNIIEQRLNRFDLSLNDFDVG